MVLGQYTAVLVGTGWYLVVLGQYNLVLLGIKWNWVSIGLLCLYILKDMEIWLAVTIAGRQTNKRTTNKERCSYSADGPWRAEMSKYGRHIYLSGRVVWLG